MPAAQRTIRRMPIAVQAIVAAALSPPVADGVERASPERFAPIGQMRALNPRPTQPLAAPSPLYFVPTAVLKSSRPTSSASRTLGSRTPTVAPHRRPPVLVPSTAAGASSTAHGSSGATRAAAGPTTPTSVPPGYVKIPPHRRPITW